MQIVEKYKWFIVAAVAVIVVGLLYFNSREVSQPAEDTTNKVSQEEKKAAEKKKKEAEAKAKAEEAKKGTLTYSARPGDSYTVLARKAVQSYAEATNSKLSKAHIVAAETFLTVDAGSPLLEIGQKVALDKSVVAKAVKKAQSLTAAEVAAWQVYVPYVNFDTSQNG